MVSAPVLAAVGGGNGLGGGHNVDGGREDLLDVVRVADGLDHGPEDVGSTGGVRDKFWP